MMTILQDTVAITLLVAGVVSFGRFIIREVKADDDLPMAHIRTGVMNDENK